VFGHRPPADAHRSWSLFPRRLGERGIEAWALCLLSQVASHRDSLDPVQAETYYREALTLATELGMRPLVAHCHLGLGKLYRRTGRREQAREHLATATMMYREMDKTYWLNRRRFLLTSLAGALAAPLSAGAQQAGRLYRIGYLSPDSGPSLTATPSGKVCWRARAVAGGHG
jgi:tetratricopeptide (TPR) repeat protein